MLVIIKLAVKILQYKGNKGDLDSSAYDALLNMLSSNGIDLKSESIQIVASKRHLFDTLKNTIIIRNFELKTAFDHIASLHEGGHYLSINQNTQRRKRFLIASFFNHLFLALLITIAIPLLYSMFLFAV